MSYKEDIPILVNYQAARDNNFPGLKLGTDRSYNYSNNKGVFLYLYDLKTSIAVGLKSFLKSFSISYKFEVEKTKTPSTAKEEVKHVGANYKLSLDIPAISANDAKVNAARLDTLTVFMGFTGNRNLGNDDSGNPIIPQQEPIYVLLSNLINNGKYTKKINVSKASDITTYGLECYIKGFSYEVDIEMGFFEESNKLWPKSYTLNLDLIAATTPSHNGTGTKLLFRDLKDDGSVKTVELASGGSYPFGVKI